MQIVVLTNPSLKEELLCSTGSLPQEIVWIEDISRFQEYKEADVFIDLLFEKDHIKALEELLPGLVIINSVEHTLRETHRSFVRINGWPTFLKSSIIEASALDEEARKKGEEAFAVFDRSIEWLPDEAGFVTPRVICMIINEAFMAIEEKVSTREDIDTAMKLGTNYPFGPFEWAEKIGTRQISSLLQTLQKENSRYRACRLLVQS